MYDLLPFPSIMEKTPEKQIIELTSYLMQFKESLEFILTNIGAENLSPKLMAQLQKLGTEDSESTSVGQEEFTQLASRSLTISDVVNSELFENSVKDISGNVELTINYETGNLEYN